MMTTHNHWTLIPMVRSGESEPDEIPTGANAERIRYLREYRETNGITGVWLCSPEELADEELDNTYMGPTVDDIDWSDFPA